MFGKGARQIQADPTLDLTKCKCCECDKAACTGCLEGHFIKNTGILSGEPQSSILRAGECCHSPDNGLIFEFERPGSDSAYAECCPDANAPIGQPPGYRRCCRSVEYGASNVRFYYNYIGQYFRIDYVAAGHTDERWPNNGRPRLCSKCNPASIDSERKGTWPQAEETCVDFWPDRSIDDNPDIDSDYPCMTQGIPFVGCQCMGEGLQKDTDRFSKRLSYHRKREMERLPYYRWLADVMCYDKGNVVSNPYFKWTEENVQPEKYDTNGTLYEHLVGVVHCEHWYEIVYCDENPQHGDGECLGKNTIGECVNTSRYAPRFWVWGCSGVPIFDWELIEATKYLDANEIQEWYSAIGKRRTPKQQLMQKVAKETGFFEVADWRAEAIKELKELKSRKYTANAYANVPDNLLCSNLGLLGPVRKKLWKKSIEIPGLDIPGRLDPKKARNNALISPPKNTIIETPINSLVDASLVRIQLPDQYLKDPWNGGPYPVEPNLNSTADEIEEWNDFVFWTNTQWVYMNARPGGWSYVCHGYQSADPTQLDPTLTIPDLPRATSNMGAFGGCLDGLLGGPQRTEDNISGGCDNSAECGYIDDQGVFQQFPQVGCGVDLSCLAINCNTSDSPYCSEYPETGGGLGNCQKMVISSNCNGMRFRYATYKAKSIWNNVSKQNETVFTCAKTVDAMLYRINLTKGNADAFCPHVCRSLQNPIALQRDIPRLKNGGPTYVDACDQRQRDGVPSGSYRLCEGFYCFRRFIEQTPALYPGTYGGFIQADAFSNPTCCSKEGTGVVLAPLPASSLHPASNRAVCPCWQGPGSSEFYGGQLINCQPINYNSLVCCWGCNANGGSSQYFGVMGEQECRNLVISKGYTDPHENGMAGLIYTGPTGTPGLMVESQNCPCITPQCACARSDEWWTLNCDQNGINCNP